MSSAPGRPSGTVAAVLAAGAGSRFGGPGHKLLVPFRGKPLVCWALEHALAAGFDALAVVQGAVDLRPLGLPEDVVVLENPAWAEGMAGSLQTAVRWAQGLRAEALVIGLGDQPLVSPATWRAVRDGTAPLTFCEADGIRCPPVRLARSVFPLLPSAGDGGASVLARRRPELVGTVASADPLLDVDRPEDLARLERLAQEAGTT
ncbi:NTP transferase domain-containing protein [Aciditerrimonas ferrireducens]|uniref:NTP transferase domain-containing protein n=1 Tax=Aciditerrimonas ferrireducens TaxID=667306 RepID=A0ABV6C1W5_9ACTN